MFSHRRRFLRQGAAFCPRLEQLERRDCPSCTVFQKEQTLFILGDEAANQIAIADTREGGIAVSCDRGETERFTGVNRIELRTQGGDDEITATFQTPPEPVFEFRAQLGAGNDRLSISGFDPQPDPPLRSVEFDIRAGEGDDTIAATFACPADPTNFHFSADLGAGNDRLDINWFDPQPDPPGRAVRFDIAGGEGNDDVTFNMGGITINGQFVMNVNGGDGNDSWTMNLGDLMINGEFVMDASGGAGDDALIVRAILPCVSPEGQVRFGLDGGAGNDRLGVLVNGAGDEDGGSAQILGTLQLDLHGGGGDDRTILDIVTLDIRGAVLVNVDGARGTDHLLMAIAADVRVFGLLDVKALGGGENDVFDSSVIPCILPAGRGELTFEGGAGDDLLDVDLTGLESSGQLVLQLAGGIGNDRLLLGAAEPCWLPGSETSIRLVGNAGDDFIEASLRGLEIEGQFVLEVGGGIGNDHLSLVAAEPCVLPESETRIELLGHAGDDLIEVSMTGLEIEGGFDLAVFGGIGNDILDSFVEPCILPAGRASFQFEGGEGADRIAARFEADEDSQGALDVRVLGGLGDDELTLALLGVDDLALLTALLDGGREFDIARVTRNVRVANCEEVMFVDEPR